MCCWREHTEKIFFKKQAEDSDSGQSTWFAHGWPEFNPWHPIRFPNLLLPHSLSEISPLERIPSSSLSTTPLLHYMSLLHYCWIQFLIPHYYPHWLCQSLGQNMLIPRPHSYLYYPIITTFCWSKGQPSGRGENNKKRQPSSQSISSPIRLFEGWRWNMASLASDNQLFRNTFMYMKTCNSYQMV